MKTALAAAMGLALVLGAPASGVAGEAESNFWKLQEMWADMRAEKARPAPATATKDEEPVAAREKADTDATAATTDAAGQTQPRPKPATE